MSAAPGQDVMALSTEPIGADQGVVIRVRIVMTGESRGKWVLSHLLGIARQIGLVVVEADESEVPHGAAH